MREVWLSRHLMYELARADLFRHTSRLRLGMVWWFVDPLVLALIYWGLVDQLLGRGASIHPRYWLFLLLGLIVWKQFAQCLSSCSGVYNRRQGLIRNISVPLVTLPGAVVLQTFYLFVQALLVVAVLSGVSSGASLGWFQVIGLMTLQLLTMGGIGMMFAGPMASQPDLRALLPHALKVLFYLSPVLYSFEFLQLKIEGTSYIQLLNTYRLIHPLADLLGAYRTVLLDNDLVPLGTWLSMGGRTVVCLVLGLWLHSRCQHRLLEALR